MNLVEILFWLCSLLILYTYIGYPFVLFIISRFVRKARRANELHTPSVSVLIGAYNEEAVIEDKIKNCLAIDYPKDKLEILIGSDGSTDQTNRILRTNAGGAIRFTEFAQRRGKAAVLNDLVRMAKGEVLVFSDANSMYRPDAVKRLVSSFVDQNVGVVCGRLILLNHEGKAEAEGERLYWDYENYLKYLEGTIKSVLGANGAIYAIRSELFSELPTDKVVTDDFLISMRIVQAGYVVVYEKTAVAWEYTSPNVRDEFKRKVRIGAANFHGIRHILPLLNPLNGFIAFGLWSHKIIRWIVPFLLIGIFVTSLLLLDKAFYRIAFFAQAIFYGMVLIAWVMDHLKLQIRLLIYPYYFVMANLALLVGFFKFITNSQKPTWTRVER